MAIYYKGKKAGDLFYKGAPIVEGWYMGKKVFGKSNPYLITGKSTYTSPFTLKINNRDRTVTLNEGGDWELNVESYLPLTSLREFASRKTITECKFPKNFDTSNVSNMRNMFQHCSGLTTLDLSNFNTENVTDIGYMFYECSNLTSLDLSNFNTENVTDMYCMFSRCSSLTSLDISNFNTEKVTKMNYMFDGCENLTSLDVSNFNTLNVPSMSGVFRNCSALTTLDVSNFSTEKVTDMSDMFRNCSGLTTLDLSNFNTENVTTMFNMFDNCTALTSLDISKFDTSKVTNLNFMFQKCSALTTINMCAIGDGTKNVWTSNMFTTCTNLANIPSCGEIHNTVNFSDCPLTLDSAKVILNALSTPYSGAQEITFSTSTKALVNADTDTLALVEQKRLMGWTISL